MSLKKSTTAEHVICGAGHKMLLVFSIINGMTLAVTSDLIAKSVFYPREIEVGIVTSLLGAPFFLFLLRKRVNGHHS